jgi:hypothetical protein
MSKKSIKIIVTIVESELLDEYQDVHPDLIISDFREEPRAFLDYSDIDIEISPEST